MSEEGALRGARESRPWKGGTTLGAEALGRRPGQVRPFLRIGKYTHNNRQFRVQPHLSRLDFNVIVEV